jgi:SAM-dependent methyltransferase
MRFAGWRRRSKVFSADWLTLREPADAAARSVTLARAIAGAFNRANSMRALDLGCGTGANARFMADHVDAPQDWLLVDRDAGLLDHVPPRMAAWAAARGAEIAGDPGPLRVTREGRAPASFRTLRADLRLLDDPAVFEGRALVAASALLDLVSEPWVRTLALRCRAAGACALFALTYDGRVRCTPEEPDDERVRRLVNEHQRTDKGFGLALGPTAVEVVERRFAEIGYRSRRERSDWVLDSTASELQRQLIAGWSEAAMAMAAEQDAIRGWKDRRLIHVDEGRSQLVVGHEDLALWPE